MRKNNKNNNTEVNVIQWKRRPSEIRGYQRTLYATADNRDYLRVDYSIKEKRVRLYTEIAREGGTSYYSIISAGKITSERSASTGRSTGVAEKLSQRSEDFSTLNVPEVIRLIAGNYGIGVKRSSAAKSDVERRKEETRKRYFKESDLDMSSAGGQGGVFSKVKWFDFFDVFIGVMVAGLFFWYFQYSLVMAGIISAFYGIIIGLVDMFFRQRAPVFTKLIVFVSAGIFLYVYGYFY